jgi:transcriptional regulator of acetoin/glycerol metabolism
MRSRRFPITSEEILKALEVASGDVAAAAQALDVSERTLYRRMREFGIRPVVRYESVDEVAV